MRNSIPQAITNMYRDSNNLNTQNTDISLMINGLKLVDKRCNNRHIRNTCQTKTFSVGQYKWNTVFENVNWKSVTSQFSKFCVFNKTKETAFKILHNIYPTNTYLQRFNKDIDLKCTFCNVFPETLPHLFFECFVTNFFWAEVEMKINKILDEKIKITRRDVLLNHYKSGTKKEIQYIINLLIMLAKNYIHKRKWAKKKPCYVEFILDVKYYMHSLYGIKNKKAKRTLEYWEYLNLDTLLTEKLELQLKTALMVDWSVGDTFW